MPLLVGLVLQVEALGGFLAGVILSGQLLAVFMANAGGAWDNAKKSIEDEPRDLVANTGKGSERHKAGVVGDTVGDPLKDTAGPALNPMIKVVNLVSLLAAPIIVQYQNLGVGGWIVVFIAGGRPDLGCDPKQTSYRTIGNGRPNPRRLIKLKRVISNLPGLRSHARFTLPIPFYNRAAKKVSTCA